MNQWVLMGHRGVGKSWLRKKLSQHFKGLNYASLDSLIVEREQRTIDLIFKDEGEAYFRKLEIKTFENFLETHSQSPFVLDLGAGFLGEIPKQVNVLWIKRASAGRFSVFVDRPQLDSAFTVSEQRFSERESRYAQRADLTLELREGEEAFNHGEKQFFSALLNNEKSMGLKSYFYTLQKGTSELEINVLRNLGCKGFELRDDLVSGKTKGVEIEPALFSFRRKRPSTFPEEGLWDWPLEWGYNSQASILSLHQRQKTVEETLKILPDTPSIVKLAIPIENFSELKLGHEWAQEPGSRRVFLPMSDCGRWSWYRQLMADSSLFQFVRLGTGSAQDQPSVLEVLNRKPNTPHFAAVIGTPVAHSQTPSFHQNYFSFKNANTFAIEVRPQEFEVALSFLAELGLRWVAVTSPLKVQAQQWVGAEEPVNTLFFDNESWSGTNTDFHGFAVAVKDHQNKSIAVWGGGGTLQALQKSIPHASFFSSRSGELKVGNQEVLPEVLIWAVGQSSFKKEGCYPPESWPMKRVIDLNYSQDSPGRICALKYGCQYQSGLVMFAAQAKKQQEFWDECRLK